MKYEVNFDGKKASVEFSDGLTSGELYIVEDVLHKCVEEQVKKAKIVEATQLTIDDSINAIYPPLSVRATNVLLRAGKKTIKDVLNCTPSELQNIRNMGRNTLEEIHERFRKYGVFKEEPTGSEGSEE